MSDFDYFFEWDGDKAAANKSKHGVSFVNATAAIRDPLALTIFDSEHSTSDDRWITIGRSADGGHLVVVHTWLDLGLNSARVRIISARKKTRNEQRMYEKTL